MRNEGAKVGTRPDMRELPKIPLRDRTCAHHRSTSVVALVVMVTPSACRAGGDGMDEHVSLREEARTVCQIGEGSHFHLEARVQEAAFHCSLQPRRTPTSSDSFHIVHIVLISIHFIEFYCTTSRRPLPVILIAGERIQAMGKAPNPPFWRVHESICLRATARPRRKLFCWRETRPRAREIAPHRR